MEEAASRTARLQALRAAKERRAHANPDSSSAAVEPAAGDSAAAAGPKIIFRNYQPSDKSLQETSKLPRAGVAKAAIPAKVADDDNVLNVIAKKANWDLKRDIQPKLQKLERRTEVRSFASQIESALLLMIFVECHSRYLSRAGEGARGAASGRKLSAAARSLPPPHPISRGRACYAPT
jgi:coiled-coil domain-containing protein 12